MKHFTLLFAAAAAATCCALPALAQDVTAEPTYETITLAAGFPNDPYFVDLQAGGDIDASAIGDNCVGFIASAPDIRLHYAAGDYPLSFTSIADTDTTLVVNAPDGSWHCDDDSAGDTDPLVSFTSPQAGQYDVWVGSYADASLNDATLFITELTPNELSQD